MTDIFKINLDLSKNIGFILDAIFEIGIGIVILYKNPTDTVFIIIGVGFILVGIIQFIRKLKTFHLTNTDLTIKRPLFPFQIAQENYPLAEIKEIKFNKIKGGFGGPHLIVNSKNKNGAYRIETTKENIDKFEIEMTKLDIKITRIGM